MYLQASDGLEAQEAPLNTFKINLESRMLSLDFSFALEISASGKYGNSQFLLLVREDTG